MLYLLLGNSDVIEQLLVGGNCVFADARLIVVIVATALLHPDRGGDARLGQTMACVVAGGVRCSVTVYGVVGAAQWLELLPVRARL
jgi:hypothetical protein